MLYLPIIFVYYLYFRNAKMAVTFVTYMNELINMYILINDIVLTLQIDIIEAKEKEKISLFLRLKVIGAKSIIINGSHLISFISQEKSIVVDG